MFHSRSRIAASFVAALALASVLASPADARRGGSFGSRGSRTYLAPRATSLSQSPVGPMQRSMTQPSLVGSGQAASPWRSPAASTPGYPQAQPARRFGGFGTGLVGGLLAGGLIGSLMGHGGGWGMGYGGMGGGFLISLMQLMLLGGAIWFAIGFFRRGSRSIGGDNSRPAPTQYAAGPASAGPNDWNLGGWGASSPEQAVVEIALTDADRSAFEQMLADVQDAFGREDYARLRALTTPEIMSYLSEELSQNATSGRRNEVSATRLIDAEVAEAWREGETEYATIAMRYESIDVMRDRATGAIVSGDPARPSLATETWTFVRPISGSWKLSAIQE